MVLVVLVLYDVVTAVHGGSAIVISYSYAVATDEGRVRPSSGVTAQTEACTRSSIDERVALNPQVGVGS